jgi:hypothetical protein
MSVTLNSNRLKSTSGSSKLRRAHDAASTRARLAGGIATLLSSIASSSAEYLAGNCVCAARCSVTDLSLMINPRKSASEISTFAGCFFLKASAILASG